jgi:hypothetical protein
MGEVVEMIRVIVESPYGSADPEIVERNVRFLRACLRDCLKRGEAPFASHAIYTQPGVLDDNNADERMNGIDAGFAWRRCAEKTVVYTNLGISNGMVLGIRDSEIRGVQTEYRVLDGWPEVSQ